MIHKLIRWFMKNYKKNACKECDYYCADYNTCQSKKCATCGRHPYVNWFDRHFCEPYKAESEGEG